MLSRLTTASTRSNFVRLTFPAPGLIHTDGETHAADRRLHIRVHPASLRLVVPATTEPVTPPREPAELAASRI